MISIASVNDNRHEYFLKTLSQSIEKLDFKQVQVAHRVDSKTSIDDLLRFALQNLTHEYHTVRMACATIIKRMCGYLIEKDVEQLSRRTEQEKQTPDDPNDSVEWHLLHKFRTILTNHNVWTQQYIEEFKYVYLLILSSGCSLKLIVYFYLFAPFFSYSVSVLS